MTGTNAGHAAGRIPSIDFLRGLAMIVMALDHVRLYLGPGTWYAEPTNLAATTPLLFFTRWITHFCAPVFVFLAGTSAFLYGARQGDTRTPARFLFTRGLWLVFVELVIVSFAWTFDITYSFIILQVIWAIGLSMIVLSLLVLLPQALIAAVGLMLVLGHNLLDPLRVQGSSARDLLWHTLHQPGTVALNGTLIDFVYPVLPWAGLMALGYVLGGLYRADISPQDRRRWLAGIGIAMILAFLVLRGLNLYGEPRGWQAQATPLFTLMSLLNTTKYPPSLHFLLMTMGPALVLLALVERAEGRLPRPPIVFGRVPLFFYILHLYAIHALAMLILAAQGGRAGDYILSARAIRSGQLADFGLGLPGVYLVWAFVVLLLYPACRWYRRYREAHPQRRWWSYL